MTQNISTAVMQRRVEPHYSLDDYPTPPWATRALCEWLTAQGYPPRAILQFTERVPMNRGRMEANMTTATAYCWIVWTAGWTGRTEFHWIAPCRKRLERADDYTTEAAA